MKNRITESINPAETEETENPDLKKSIPKEVQQKMLEFFMQTSIPRKVKRKEEKMKKQNQRAGV